MMACVLLFSSSGTQKKRKEFFFGRNSAHAGSSLIRQLALPSHRWTPQEHVAQRVTSRAEGDMAAFARRSGAAARSSLLRSLLGNAARLRPTVDVCYFSHSVAPILSFLSPRASIVTAAAGRWTGERRWSAAGLDGGGWRSVSSSALAGQGRFVRDERQVRARQHSRRRRRG